MKCPNCGFQIVTRRTAKREKTIRGRSLDARIRVMVMESAGGKCQNCGVWKGEALELDHFFGRARDRSLSGCWALCSGCHLDKTNNRPSRAYWLQRFRDHVAPFDASKAVRCDELLALATGKRRAG